MITIEKLNAFGVNTAEGLSRCMGSEPLYLKLVGKLCGEKKFDELYEAVQAGDLDRAFEAAHALKGVLGNLSVTPIYEKTVELTELLRVKAEADYVPMAKEIVDMHDEFKKLFE